MRWVITAAAALAAYVLIYVVSRPTLGRDDWRPEPDIDPAAFEHVGRPSWRYGDIYDEIASGPAD